MISASIGGSIWRVLEIAAGHVQVALLIVLFFGITIFVHEFGHFAMARICGMVVDVFSIGFGPAVWKRRFGEITYKIGVIPFGGYVALPQLDPASMSTVQGTEGEEASRKLPRISPWLKILVSLAGAMGNVCLALLMAWVVHLWGMTEFATGEESTLGYVESTSAAFDAGLRIGDKVLSANGLRTRNWSDLMNQACRYEELLLVVERDGGSRDTLFVPTELRDRRVDFRGIPTILGVFPRGPCVVASVLEGMPADEVGIKEGDVIREVSGVSVASSAHVRALVTRNGGNPVQILVERQVKGATVSHSLVVTPRQTEALRGALIGIEFLATEYKIRPVPWQQFRYQASAILEFLGRLVTPSTAREAAKQTGGPVAIVISYVRVIGVSIVIAIWFTGFLNVNLAVINLLPLPVLDGGHIVFSLWEVVTRRPPNPKVVNVLVNIFAVMLISLFVMLSVFDVGRFTGPGANAWKWVKGRWREARGLPSIEETTELVPQVKVTEPEVAAP